MEILHVLLIICLSRLIMVFIAQSYINYIQISGGKYIPYGDGIHTASLVIGIYDDTNEITSYEREGEIWRTLAFDKHQVLNNNWKEDIRFWQVCEDIRYWIWRRFWH